MRWFWPEAFDLDARSEESRNSREASGQIRDRLDGSVLSRAGVGNGRVPVTSMRCSGPSVYMTKWPLKLSSRKMMLQARPWVTSSRFAIAPTKPNGRRQIALVVERINLSPKCSASLLGLWRRSLHGSCVSSRS
jgi:hypothetical protein